MLIDTHFKELPTLLHCAAKFGLKNLAIHLLQCSGATWASQIKNVEGSDPAYIAERHGHKELKKIFEDFSVSLPILSLKLFLLYERMCACMNICVCALARTHNAL